MNLNSPWPAYRTIRIVRWSRQSAMRPSVAQLRTGFNVPMLVSCLARMGNTWNNTWNWNNNPVEEPTCTWTYPYEGPHRPMHGNHYADNGVANVWACIHNLNPETRTCT